MNPELILFARKRKAELLAKVLENAGADAADVALLDARGRRAAEGLAGVPVSSDETWSMVADILTSRGALRARLASLPADPFSAFDV